MSKPTIENFNPTFRERKVPLNAMVPLSIKTEVEDVAARIGTSISQVAAFYVKRGLIECEGWEAEDYKAGEKIETTD